MKKFLLILALFPFLTFGSFDYQGYTVNYLTVFTYKDFDVTVPFAGGSSAYRIFANSLDELYSGLSSSVFGLKIHTPGYGPVQQVSSIVPSCLLLQPSSLPSITNSVYCSSNGVSVSLSPYFFPKLGSIYTTVSTLYCNGYRGSGIVSSFSSDNNQFVCINVNYPLLLADVLSSTNTVFRQILLHSLNSISSGVASIDSGVSSLAPSVSSILDVNQNIFTNTSVIVDSIDNVVDELDEIRENTQILAKSSDITNAANVVSSAAASAASDIVDSLIGDYDETPTRGSKAYSSRTSIKSQMKDWRSDLKTQLNDWKADAKKQLNDWKADLKQDLQAWKTSDEAGILNIRNDLDSIRGTVADSVSSANSIDSHLNDYFVDRTNPDNPFYGSSSIITNGISDSSDKAAGIITNGVSDSSDKLAGIITNSFQQGIDDLKDKLFNGNDWLNVRVMYPIHGQDQEAVNVHLDGWDNYEFIDHERLAGTLKSTFEGIDINLDWYPWFDRWDPFSEGVIDWLDKWDPFSDVVTNYYSEYNSSAPVADLARSFLSDGFDIDTYNGLPWFSRVEVLLAMIADVSGGSTVVAADIEDSLNDLADDFKNLGTNVVSSSASFVGLFDYVRLTAGRFKSVFGDHSAPATSSGITLLSAGNWIGQEPLVLKLDITVQNVLRLFFRCFWLLSALVVLWLVLSWSWQKVLAVLRWLWSMFDL